MSEPMPRPHQYKPLKEIRTLDEAVDHPEVILRFKNALGEDFGAVQYLATIRNLSRENELFKRADPWEVIRCALDLAEIGLRPNTPFGHAWIIPRVKNRDKPDEKITLDPQIGYQGYLELAFRANTLQSIHADVVYEDDLFECEYGTNAHLRHIPKGARRGRRPLKVYCHAHLNNGGQAFIAWDYLDVLEIRDTSEAYKYALQVKNKMPWVWDTCVWVKWEYPMLRKTMVTQLLKELPKSSENLARAAWLDGLGAAGKLSYEGRPGDLSSGPRELTHQHSATLHDIGFRAPTVEGKAEAVASGGQQGKPAATRAATATQGAKAASDQKPTNGGASAYHDGPPPGHPAHGGPEDDQGAQIGNAQPSAQQRQSRLYRLISADGDVLIQGVPILEWAKEFADHLKEVPADMMKAFEEHNWDSILDAVDDPETKDIMRAAGWNNDPDTGAAGQGANDPSATQIPSAAEMLVTLPAGRVNVAEITMLFRNALEPISSPEWLKAWQNANQAVLNGLETRLKLLAYREIGQRKKELGITE